MSNVLVKAWNCVKTHAESMGKKEEGFPIWRMEYSSLTDIMEVDLEYGAQFTQLKKKTFLSAELPSLSYGEIEYSLINGAVKKYNMNTRPLIIPTALRQRKALPQALALSAMKKTLHTMLVCQKIAQLSQRKHSRLGLPCM